MSTMGNMSNLILHPSPFSNAKNAKDTKKRNMHFASFAFHHLS